MAWKDEAYELGSQWAKLYETDSTSHKLIADFIDNSFLVNVVNNDFHNPEAIFGPFFRAGAELVALNGGKAAGPAPTPITNGH